MYPLRASYLEARSIVPTETRVQSKQAETTIGLRLTRTIALRPRYAGTVCLC